MAVEPEITKFSREEEKGEVPRTADRMGIVVSGTISERINYPDLTA